MSPSMNENETSEANAAVPLLDAEKQKQKKRKDKVRSAWISFAGRIVAQILGAVATVALGLLVLHSYAASNASAPSGGDPAPELRSAPAGSARPAGEIFIAVLPLENFSAGSEEEYLADGMTEALITDLSKVDSLRVISRTSSMHYKGQRKPLPAIARELGVQWIVEGSVARSGQRVRVTAQLIDAGSDRHVWAQSYDHPLGDVLSLREEIARAIARQIAVTLTPSTPQSEFTAAWPPEAVAPR